jgi:CubicO group peptidase (beta-lactamase class C family)
MKNILLIISLVLLNFQILFAQERSRDKFSPQIDSLISNYYPSGSSPGIAISIIVQGEMIYSNQVGMANLENMIPITDSTAFHIASVSKQFTSFLALRLEEEGKLSMSDDLRIHIPELKKLPYKITLKQLANHTHGLPNLFELAQLRGIGVEDRMTHEEVVQMLLQIKQINFKPGYQYEYNNTGYVLLAEVIERIVGKPFQTVLKERVLSPFGMINTTAVPKSDMIIKNKAHSYRLEGDQYKNYAFNIMANGSSGISTTIHDLASWAVNFQFPEKGSQKILQKMQEPTRLANGEVVNYGLGLEWKNYKGLDVVFHGGGDAGYRSYILHVPKQQFSIVIMGNNNDFAPFELTYDIIDFYFKEHQTTYSPKKTTYTTKELKLLEGTYEFAPGTYYNIIAERDTLYFQSYGTRDKAPLPVIGDDVFLFPYIPTAKCSFYEGGFDFLIADFKYSCKKVNLDPPNRENIQLSEFIGLYRNAEFNTEYEIVISEDHLVAKHSFNEDTVLYPLAENSFYSPSGSLGQIDFIKSKQGEIMKFNLSRQNIKNLEFKKIE